MGSIFLSSSCMSYLKGIDSRKARKMAGAVERIRVHPERYLRKMLMDPAYRLQTEDCFIYLDISGDDLILLRMVERGRTEREREGGN